MSLFEEFDAMRCHESRMTQWLVDRAFSAVVRLAFRHRIVHDRHRHFPDGKRYLLYAVTHQSQMDAMLVNELLLKNRRDVQYVAGENLNFFPLGIFLRARAFFIKRSYRHLPKREKAAYLALLNYYVGTLVNKNVSLVYSIEGKRSRTGEVLPARPGLLGLILTQFNKVDEYETMEIVPVGINYDMHPEALAFLRGNEEEPVSFRYVLIHLFRLLRGARLGCYLNVGDSLVLRKGEQNDPVELGERIRDALIRSLPGSVGGVVHDLLNDGREIAMDLLHREIAASGILLEKRTVDDLIGEMLRKSILESRDGMVRLTEEGEECLFYAGRRRRFVLEYAEKEGPAEGRSTVRRLRRRAAR